jgi:hypothetical protein
MNSDPVMFAAVAASARQWRDRAQRWSRSHPDLSLLSIPYATTFASGT